MSTWTISFKSTLGVDCSVSISGMSTDKTLVPAAEAFVMEEDKSLDMLSFIRYRTGYIRVIEQVGEDLSEVFPATPKEHPVIATYGEATVFKGYVQCASYTLSGEPKPRVMEIPVISQLGVLGETRFSIPDLGMVDVSDLMDEILTETGISSYIYPTDSGNPFSGKMYSVGIAPFKDTFERASWYTHTDEDFFEPITMYSFLEGLCECFLWCLHDAPDTLIFTDLEHPTKSGVPPTPNIGSASYVRLADGCSTDYMMPISELTLSYGGEEPGDMPIDDTFLSKSSVSSDTNGTNAFKAIGLLNRDPRITGAALSYPTFLGGSGDNFGDIVDEGLYPVCYGYSDEGEYKVSPSFFWVAKTSEGGDVVFSKTFYGHLPVDPSSGFTMIDMAIETGNHMRELSKNINSDILGYISIQVGDEYYDIENDRFLSNYHTDTIAFKSDTGKIYKRQELDQNYDIVRFRPRNGTAYTPPVNITVTFSPDKTYTKINDFTIKSEDEEFAGFSHHSYQSKYILKGDGVDKGSLSPSINSNGQWSANDNTLFCDVNTPIRKLYLFRTIKFVTEKLYGTYAPQATDYYLARDGGYMISYSINMQKDEHTIIFAHKL